MMQSAPPDGPRLVATLGPVSFASLAELVAAGADAFRLNASHMDPDALAEHVRAVRRLGAGTPVVVDIQGAKVRLGRFSPRDLAVDDRVVFALEPETGTGEGADALPLPHPEVFAAVQPGEHLWADDGRLTFVVLEVTPDRLVAESLSAGVLRPRKGVNRADHPVSLVGLSLQDRAHLAAADLGPGDAIACSFMADGSEAAWIRSVAPGVPIIGKVERAEALDHIDAIADAVDALWICRGDLGAQVGLSRMASWIGGWSPAASSVPALMAGQVLEHLTHHPEPTRSEVCHVFDLLGRGYAGIVLSDETAVGADPVGAVKVARALLDARA